MDFQRQETRYISHKTQISLQLESSFSICATALISLQLIVVQVEEEENGCRMSLAENESLNFPRRPNWLGHSVAQKQEVGDVLPHPSLLSSSKTPLFQKDSSKSTCFWLFTLLCKLHPQTQI